MTVADFVPLGASVAGAGLLLGALHWFLVGRHPHLGSERLFPRQLLMLGLTLVALIGALFTLPVESETRNQILGVFGLLISGVFAFSSTTVVANLFAGLLLRVTQPFAAGDFVRVGEAFGRVSERGLFDTEIQSEARELIAIPNAWLLSQPIRTTLKSGTIISANLSLGYDVHHRLVEELLREAAQAVGLAEPFVHVVELGDFAVSYRVSGLLTEVKWLMTARSDLNRSVLDVLHGAGIEIASPGIMAQRPLPADSLLIPELDHRPVPASDPAAGPVAEDLAFDKAERAARIEAEREALSAALAGAETALAQADANAREAIAARVDALRKRLVALAEEKPAEPDKH